MITVQTKLSPREISELEKILKNTFNRDKKGKKFVWAAGPRKIGIDGYIENEQGKYFEMNAVLEGESYSITLKVDIGNKNYPKLLEECRTKLVKFYETLIRYTAN